MHLTRLIVLSLLALGLTACAASGPARLPGTGTSWAPAPWALGAVEAAPAGALPASVAVDDDHGFVWDLVMYLPNRIFDVFDIVRARLRIGPGIGLGLRATELADVYLGTYASIWVGLHGHRGEPEIPWPFGLESLTGAELSVADASVDAGADPDYGPFEFGLDTQLFLVGFAVGIEPFEILDLVVGIIGIDPSKDDF